jgi:hypothetical protein
MSLPQRTARDAIREVAVVEPELPASREHDCDNDTSFHEKLRMSS